jgi:ribosomal protein S18 acetylase RimI-like enzyme
MSAVANHPFQARLSIRRATPGDAAQVVALVRESFRPRDLGLTIYGCSGVAAYLDAEFATPREVARSSHLVSVAEGPIAGYIEMRRSPGGLWLNYIATDPGWRRRGIGTALIRDGLAACGEAPGTKWILDVFDHNAQARRWYEAMGFRTVARLGFWRIENRSTPLPGVSAAIVGLPQADAAHQRFGFSRFTVAERERSFKVGRLGERWWRITDPEILRAPGALSALRRIEPFRELLLCCPESCFEPGAGPGCERLLTSVRYESKVPAYAE